MKKRSVFFCLLMMGWGGNLSPSAAQSLCGYEKVAQIPLEDTGGYLLGRIQINDRTVHVIVDTGSEGSLISRQGAEQLQLPVDPEHKTILYGSKGERDVAQNVFIHRIGLNGYYDLGPVSVPVGELSQYPRVDPPVVGLIGGDILSGFDLEFDVQAKTLSFWNVESRSMLCNVPPFWQARAHVMAIGQKGYRAFIEVRVDGFPVRALLDSGARSKILSEAKVREMGIRPETLATRPGGLASSIASKDVVYHWYQFHRLEIGGQVDKEPVLTISPLYDDADMLVGSDWFATRKVWISYKRGKLFFMDWNG